MKIIVDIDVWNCQIRGAKPELQTKMPNDDVGKTIFWDTAPLGRFDNRIYGNLKGKAYRQALRIVEKYGAINISGEYGSIKIDEEDFEAWNK